MVARLLPTSKCVGRSLEIGALKQHPFIRLQVSCLTQITSRYFVKKLIPPLYAYGTVTRPFI
jgi:hypothetical protein